MSVNRLILEILKYALLGKDRKPRRYGDLDWLADRWTAGKAAAFDKAVTGFDTIDAELWP
ncbi:MAG: hypothetical protein NT080_09160 [Spirochaetes bacterium]|nr:hypothetical protein [Spirochaetota bacterium]